MTILRFESPLVWPEGMKVTPRTQQRSDHGFSTTMTLSESIGFLDEELSGLQVDHAVLFSDTEQLSVERLRKKIGSRTGACLHMKYAGHPYVLACDRWQALDHNIYALHLVLRQARNVERWGVGTLAMAIAGFEADRMPDQPNQSGEMKLEPWMTALGLGPTATLDDAIAIYHRRAKQTNNDNDALARLNSLIEEVRAYFGSKG